MSYHQSPLPFPTAIILVFISWLSFDALAQNTIAECGPYLLPLAQCAPFVQGMAATPAQSCCHSLDQLYIQKHTCLCLLLNDSTLSSSFPINTTLALQLPLLCNLQIDISTCAAGTTSLSSLSPPTQVSFGAKPNSSIVAASPIVTETRTPSFKGFGFHQSAKVRLKAERHLLLLLLLVALVSIMPTQYAEI